MSALDVCEPEIIRALEKDGWRILEKPFTVRVENQTVYADFSVQRTIDDQWEEIVILEVKCFTHPKNDLSEFYTAVGQYRYYRAALSIVGIEFPLFLALPNKAYIRLSKSASVRKVIQDDDIQVVVIDTDKEEVVQWIT